MELAIEAKGLDKVYRGGVRALHGVDLSVPRGVCYGLLGPNGAGKSTLVKALLGLVHPSAGTASLFGVDIRQAAARQGVGYLPEGHAFPPYLSGRGVCRYFGRLGGMGGAELEREIGEKLEWVGMSARADERVTTYSKGMKQRVGLAQALIGRPRLVFLDEPTDGLDPLGRSEIRDVIRRVVAEGTTIFFNSHLLSEVEQVCDELAILKDGQVLRRGRGQDLIAEMSALEGAGLRLAVDCGALPEALWTQLEARGATRLGEGFRITLGDREQISSLVDELRGAGVAIYALKPETKSLESAFLDLIRGPRASAGPGAEAQESPPRAQAPPAESEAPEAPRPDAAEGES